MVERRRSYTKRQKVTVALAADMTSTLAAATAAGIPESTVRGWLSDPVIAKLRENARAGMAEEAMLLARLALQRLGQAIDAGELDGRDLVMAFGVAVDKANLLNGQATSRTETRDLTDSLDDHEREALADAIDAWIAERGADTAPALPEGEVAADLR